MHRAHQRESGALADALDVLVAFGVRAELAARGWDRDWPVVPAQAKNPGRWPGTRDGGWPERVTVRLPAPLVNQVLAACWHTSQDAIGKLRDWRDKHPNPTPLAADPTPRRPPRTRRRQAAGHGQLAPASSTTRRLARH